MPTDAAAWGVDVLVCSPYKFFGPHLGIAYGRREVARALAAVQGAPAVRTSRSATGSRPARSRSSCFAGFVAAVEYIESIGWEAIQAHERSLGERFLAGLPETVTLYGRPTMDGRVPTFVFTVDGIAPDDVAAAARRAGASPSGPATTTRWK